MSLPKRDGVNDRYYLIHKPDTSPEVLAEADLCIQDVLNGTARENHSAYPTVVRNHNGTPFLSSQLLERYLSKLPLKGFPYEDAVAFCDAMRRLAGWKEIDHTLRQYIEKQVRDRYFAVGKREDFFTAFPPCTAAVCSPTPSMANRTSVPSGVFSQAASIVTAALCRSSDTSGVTRRAGAPWLPSAK